MWFHFCGSNVWLLLTSPLMSEWVTLSSDRAATSPHSAVWLHEGEIQASDANPVSPSSQDPSSPRRGGLVCVTCHSQPLALPVASERRAEKCLTKKLFRQHILDSSAEDIFNLSLSNVAAHKLLVRSQQVELRSTEVPVFIWSAGLFPWVYPHADRTIFQAMCSLICPHAFPVLP